MNNNKVNLFVVGAMKAGTTTFIDTLSGHKEIYVPPIKEPHYFVSELPANLYTPSRYFDLSHYFEKEFPKPLHIAHLKSIEQYEKAYSLAGNQSYRVDASTAYLHASESVAKIKAYNPEAKIIILRRDPIARAFSHYSMDVGLGREAKSFEKVIEKEVKLLEKGQLPWNSYLYMSMYAEPISHFESAFENVLVLDFEEVVSDRPAVMQKTANFLNIEAFPIQQGSHKNETRDPRFKYGVYLLTKLGVKDVFSAVFGSKFKQSLYRFISRKKKYIRTFVGRTEKYITSTI